MEHDLPTKEKILNLCVRRHFLRIYSFVAEITFKDLPDDVICKIAIYADDTTLYSTVIRHLIYGNNLNWLLNLNLIYETLWTGARKGLLISILRKLSWFGLTSLITTVLLMSKWMGLFYRKNHLLRYWG